MQQCGHLPERVDNTSLMGGATDYGMAVSDHYVKHVLPRLMHRIYAYILGDDNKTLYLTLSSQGVHRSGEGDAVDVDDDMVLIAVLGTYHEACSTPSWRPGSYPQMLCCCSGCWKHLGLVVLHLTAHMEAYHLWQQHDMTPHNT